MIPAMTFYPALTKALSEDAAKLLNGLQFEEIQEAAKIQATKGNEAARSFLQSFQTKQKAA